ncbi:MAG: FGGY-family carbohydrate kinase [[Ruminococcus] gnavus]|nr:FGGY-family carbohydrate kinase [Mediterraneibacter gnavus]
MEQNGYREQIMEGNIYLGIELGSTRIKAVLTGADHTPIASGSYGWENQYENGIWTYHLEEIWKGLQSCYRDLKEDVQKQYGVSLKQIRAMGISAMMHGYMVFDEKEELLVPFRTWRNTITEEAADCLTETFQYNIPQRWSIAHLYQAILNQEEHVPNIRFMTTLSGYLHWKLTGEKVLGIGDAAGMFPIDSITKSYDARMLEQFEALVQNQEYPWKISEILPKVLCAGEAAGCLSEGGARLLDPSGDLQAGIVMCPPEGDAGTGMTATNSVGVRTGNVSAGTSVFAMLVLEKALTQVHREIDLVTTPVGDPVAMVHCNNCTSDLNAWVGLFAEFMETMGMEVDQNRLYQNLYQKAMEGEPDGGDILAYGYLSGEHITGMEEGRPMVVRTPGARFNLANFMRVHLYTALGALKTGMEILKKEEGVQAERIMGHGGLFKTKGVGQQIMADAMETPVAVMETAGEGGAWGIALLAAYTQEKEGRSLDQYLEQEVFKDSKIEVLSPTKEGVRGYQTFMERYTKGLVIERAAVENL